MSRKQFAIVLVTVAVCSLLAGAIVSRVLAPRPAKLTSPTGIPLSSNAVIPDEANGLRLVATVQSSDTTVAEGVSVRVAFTNVSTDPIVLMNHFDMCAWGPYFGFRQYSPSFPNGHVDHYFENSVSFNKASTPWIEIAPGQSYVFTSPVAFEEPTLLETGEHTFRVIYFAHFATTRPMIKEADAPKNLWTGRIVSEPLKVVVRE